MRRNAYLLCVLVTASLVLAACGQAATEPVTATVAQARATGPVATAGPTAPAVGASGLVGRYVLPDDPFRQLNLLPNGLAYWPDNYGTYSVADDQITFVNLYDCTEPGVYRWSLDGATLKLEKVKEPCDRRWYYSLGLLAKQPAAPYVEVEWLTHGQGFSTSAVDVQGNTYAVSYDRKTITKLGPDGTVLATLGGPGRGDGQFMGPGGVALDSSGNLYAADLDGVRIEKFDASGEYLTSFNPQASPGPLGVAVDLQDNVYVTLNGPQDHFVEKWSPEGTLLATWGTRGDGDGQFSATAEGSGPRGIAVDAEGNVWVTDPENNRLQKFDANGTYLLSLGGGGDHEFLWPFSVGIDDSGTLFVVDGAGQLFSFDAEGKPSGFWLAPLGASVRFDGQGNLFMLMAGDLVRVSLP